MHALCLGQYLVHGGGKYLFFGFIEGACTHVHTHVHTAHKHVQKGIPDPAASASQNELHSTDAVLEGGG